MIGIGEKLSSIPIMKVQHQGQEVFGLELLESIGNSIYQDKDPSEIFFKEKPYVIDEKEDGFEVRIKLPFLNGKDYTLDKFGDELVITVENQRKNLFLPKFAHFTSVSKNKYENGWLIIGLSKTEK